MSRKHAFTLVELLTVIAVIALLAAMLLPVLSHANAKARGIQCLFNQQQLFGAWKMYADDNQDRVVFAEDPLVFGGDGHESAWLPLDSKDNYRGELKEDTIKQSPLYCYSGRSSGIWKCPSFHKLFGDMEGNLRPYAWGQAINFYVGGCNYVQAAESWHKKQTIYRKSCELPPALFLFVDQREDAFDPLSYEVDMNNSENYFFGNWPAFSHSGAASFTFVDGHTELHHWRSDSTMPRPVISSTYVAADEDTQWLQSRATRNLR